MNENIPDWMRVRGYLSDFAYPAGSTFFYGPSSLSMIS